MKQRFITFLQQQGFNPEQAQLCSQHAEAVELPSQTLLCKQGHTLEYAYYLVSGLCQAYYLTDEGKSFSKEFYWQGDFIVGFESLLTQQQSPYRVATLTHCQLLRLPIKQVQLWREQTQPFYQKLLENQLLYKERKERYMLLHSPEQRYKLFSENYPELEQQLTDYQIASYIGITPISLSRIKKRLKS
ncbi:Crp/Fnr family transcriptional regulator [Dasania marina]|uniref:Crp/Fnr family transcriptional regulator n=1 Tax=Dasania marina TaxID=471499 RepID=UPI0030DDDE50|tara:strand:+ start:15073 stop:15636 length:564 start_codon:yes stop_codon:yes gene_type:complete